MNNKSLKPDKIDKAFKDLNKKPRGTRDYVSDSGQILKSIYEKILQVADKFSYKYISGPVFEYSHVFEKSIGATSDIVQLEMYRFFDRKNRELVLRPEGTSSVLRIIAENKLFNKLPLKVFMIGPMFRYERPQFGRYRQFLQASFEVIYNQNHLFFIIDAILLSVKILEALKIDDYTIHLSSLGSQQDILDYNNALSNYFKKFEKDLCDLCKPRIFKNPLRILDCKYETGKEFILNAPRLKLSLNKKEELETIYKTLKNDFNLQDKVIIDDLIVRGLDYYEGPVFEIRIKNDKFLNQNKTIIAGGGYKKNLSKFSFPDKCQGFGFGIGIDRIIDYLLLQKKQVIQEKRICLAYLLKDDQSYSYFWEIYGKLLDLNQNILINNFSKKSLKNAIDYGLENNCSGLIFINQNFLEDKMVFYKDLLNLDSKVEKISLDKLDQFISSFSTKSKKQKL